jgi:carboxyl-terminal processing protease
MLAASALTLSRSEPTGPGLPPARQRPDSRLLGLYAEAVERVAQDALFAAGSSADSIVAESLKAYLAQKDAYSDFLDAAEYAKFRQTAGASYAGIGMELEKRRDGGIYCYPLAGSPAAAAGIRPGEQLAAVDGVVVRGKSLAALAARVSGPVGSALTLEIVGTDGQHRQLSITRANISGKTISDSMHGSLRIIRLSSFGPDTRRELDYLLSNWSRASPMVLDLRGCGGGDFHAAVDIAMLFLGRGQPIAALHRRAGTRAYTNTLPRAAFSRPVFLWQDASTASAAEVFIAALVENGRGISIGATSAGKGTLQEIIPLASGGALVLTTAYLTTPRGRRFDGQGLVPMRSLGARSTTDDYAREVAAASSGVSLPGPGQRRARPAAATHGAESGTWKPIP